MQFSTKHNIGDVVYFNNGIGELVVVKSTITGIEVKATDSGFCVVYIFDNFYGGTRRLEPYVFSSEEELLNDYKPWR